MIKKMWSKRWVKVLLVLFGLMFLLVAFRNPILRGIGNWLVADDPEVKTDACFVLGGNSYERGMAAVKIHDEFPQQFFVTTGGNYPTQILCLDTAMLEAQLTRHLMLKKNIPDAQVEMLTTAHSTMEESEEILKYCTENNFHDISVISSTFHLRRVRWVFENKFKKAGIQVHFLGAASEEYDHSNWWHNEEGLIMANNEIVKLLYYAVKY